MNRTYARVWAVHSMLIAVLAISIPAITHAAEPVRRAVTPPAVRARTERNPFRPSSCRRSWSRMDSGSNTVRNRNINARICAR